MTAQATGHDDLETLVPSLRVVSSVYTHHRGGREVDRERLRAGRALGGAHRARRVLADAAAAEGVPALRRHRILRMRRLQSDLRSKSWPGSCHTHAGPARRQAHCGDPRTRRRPQQHVQRPPRRGRGRAGTGQRPPWHPAPSGHAPPRCSRSASRSPGTGGSPPAREV